MYAGVIGLGLSFQRTPVKSPPSHPHPRLHTFTLFSVFDLGYECCSISCSYTCVFMCILTLFHAQYPSCATTIPLYGLLLTISRTLPPFIPPRTSRRYPVDVTLKIILRLYIPSCAAEYSLWRRRHRHCRHRQRQRYGEWFF